MKLSPRKREQLAAFLAGLPEAAALKLFAALEADRVEGGAGLPHDALLGDLRARLLESGAALPRRRLDARRVFYTPFEDFFIGAHIEKKRRGRIARASLEPIWRLMMTHRAAAEAALAAASLDDALRRDEDSGALERALFIAAEAGVARLCESARASIEVRKTIAAALGGQPAFEDLEDIRRLLPAVERFKALHVLFPSPAAPLTEESLLELRRLFLSACEQSRAMGGYVLMALKGRLERPWRALAAFYNIAQCDDARDNEIMQAAATLPEGLFEDLEHLARVLERAGAGDLDARAAMTQTNYFADFADGLAREAARAGDNVFQNRIAACRDVAADAFGRFAEQALAALREAMPARAAGGSSRLMARRPDYAAPLNRAVIDAAASAAVLIAEAPALAARLSADPAITASIAADARDDLNVFAKDLIVEIRAAEGDARKTARRMFDKILAIAAPILDADAIGLLRDREAAAAIAA